VTFSLKKSTPNSSMKELQMADKSEKYDPNSTFTCETCNDACDMCEVFSTLYTVDIGGIFVSMCHKCLEHYNK